MRMHHLRHFFADKALELLVAGVCLQLLVGAAILWLGNRPAVIALVALVVLVLLFLAAGVRELEQRRHRGPTLGQQKAFQVPRRGVVFTISANSDKPDSAAHLVLAHLKPEFVGFLGSPQTEAANTVAALVAAVGLRPDQWKSENWTPTEIEEGKAKSTIVLNWMLKLGLDERDVVLDVTGGTATMSIAAFMAAQDRRIDVQYIQSEYDRGQRIIGSEQPILITEYD